MTGNNKTDSKTICATIADMELRDYFAAHAPFTMGDAIQFAKDSHVETVTYKKAVEALAIMCFKYADTMMKQRIV